MKTAFPETVKILARQIREARLDHAAFDTLIRPCEMSRCKATCCHDGVHLSEEEAGHIESVVRLNKDQLVSYGLELPDTVIIPVKKGVKTAVRVAQVDELALDYPTHFPKTRCVFLDSHGYCGLQKLSMEAGSDAWLHKPLTCWMHPLVLIPAGKWEQRPVLTLVNTVNDPQKTRDYPGYASCTHCGRADDTGILAWQALKAELIRLGELCGRDIFGELSAETVDWVRE